MKARSKLKTRTMEQLGFDEELKNETDNLHWIDLNNQNSSMIGGEY